MTDDLNLLMSPIEDKEHLQAWMHKFLGFTLPDQTLSFWSDSNPLDFVWQVYQAMMEGRALAILSLSGRDSGKTLALSVIDLLSILHDQRSTIHIGMTSKQASRAKAYLEDFINRNAVLQSSVNKMNTTEIQLNVGGSLVGMEILSCTPKAVQGGHASLLSLDELASSMEPQNLKAYKDAHGILGASKNGKAAIVVKITSRQAGYSLAEQELQNAARSGLKVIKWTTIDCTEACPPERSGTQPTPLWINPYNGEKLTDEEFTLVPSDRQEGFQRTTDTMDKCRTCPLAAACGGRLRHQTSTSPILRKIDDVINKIQLAGSWDWAAAQILSLQPSKEGIVYYEFDDKKHRPGWNRMWEVLTGEQVDPKIPITREQFVARAKRMGCSFVAGIDWGWTAPSTCVVACIDLKNNIYVLDAIGMTMINDPTWVQIIKDTIHLRYGIDMYVPDSENKSGIDLFRTADLPVTEVDKGPGSVKAGINVLKRFLKVPGTNEVKLFIAPDIKSSVTNVPGIVEEFGLYHKEVDATGKILDDRNPVKEHDHYLDALRYALYWFFSGARMTAIFAGQESMSQAPHPDTPIERLAELQGVRFTDNRGDFKHMGRQDDDDPKDPDDGSGGSGLKVYWPGQS